MPIVKEVQAFQRWCKYFSEFLNYNFWGGGGGGNISKYLDWGNLLRGVQIYHD